MALVVALTSQWCLLGLRSSSVPENRVSDAPPQVYTHTHTHTHIIHNRQYTLYTHHKHTDTHDTHYTFICELCDIYL